MKFRFIILIFLAFLSCNKSDNVVKTVEKKQNPTYLKAWDFFYDNKKDSAYYYLNQAKDIFIKEKDSFGAAKSLLNMGIIQESFGDNHGSVETSLSAVSFFNYKSKEQRSYISSNYNNIAVASTNLKNYSAAEEYYKKALLYTDDSVEVAMIKSNLANTFFKDNRYKLAIEIYDALLSEIKVKDEIYAKILSNYAKTKWKNNNNYNPLPLFLEALKIQEKANDLWGINGSYYYLARYYTDSNPNLALQYYNKMYEVATELNSPTDKLTALEFKIKLDNAQNAKSYFDVYDQLNDSLNTAMVLTKNQFALIRFDSEKNKALNDKLQQENQEKKYQIDYQRLLIAAIFVVSIMATVIIIVSERRKRLKAALLAENEIKTNRLITSKKVHDVVANGLYRVMSEIESTETIDKSKILYRLENMYESSRNISYDDEVNPNNLEFSEELSELLHSFDTEDVKLFIVGNSNDVWSNLNLTKKSNIFNIVQELMVNMKKHSKATRVILKFKKENNKISIDYSDNGVGFNESHKHNNGLANTVNRIEYLKGEVNFASENNMGLKINMIFPDF